MNESFTASEKPKDQEAESESKTPDSKHTLPKYDVMRLLGPFFEQIKSGGRILDLGAGSGLQANEAVKRGIRVTAVDMLERPTSVKAEEIEWIQASLEEYARSLSPDQQFDGVLLQNIIHFFPKEYVLQTLLPVIVAHVKPGASIGIETMSAPPDPILKKFQSYYSPDELLSVLEGEVLLSEKNDTQRVEDDGSVRMFHHIRVLVRRKDKANA